MLRSPDATLRLRHQTDPSDQRRVSARVFRPFRSWVSARVADIRVTPYRPRLWRVTVLRGFTAADGVPRWRPLADAELGEDMVVMPDAAGRAISRIQVSGSVPGSLGPWVPHAGDDTDRALVSHSAPSERSPSAALVPLAPIVAAEPARGKASRVLNPSPGASGHGLGRSVVPGASHPLDLVPDRKKTSLGKPQRGKSRLGSTPRLTGRSPG